MLRALWFFAQLAIVVCAAIWISAQKGSVDIAWNDYTVSVNLGIFLLGATLFTIVAVAAFRLIGAIVSAPGTFSKKRRERARAKGFKSLTRGFVAIAAGDAKKATQLAKEVRNLLPDEQGLPLLLEAQAARLRGEEDVAKRTFEKLLDDKDAAFFGIRGLLKSSMEEGDTAKALTYALRALEQNPKQPWILKSVYDLELQNQRWDDAMGTLTRIRKYKAMEEAAIRKDESALYLLLAEKDQLAGNESGAVRKIENAIKADPLFVPAAIKMAEYYIEKDKDNKAAAVIERVWRVHPHPELAVLWDRIAPASKSSDPMRRMKWFEKLVSFNPESADGHIAAARVAIESGLLGEARTHLVTAERLRPSAQVYRLRADLEEKASYNAAIVREWLDKAAQAAPDPVWYCVRTGHIYERWSPVALPHGAFNTIEWGSPLGGLFMQEPALSGWKDPLLIEQS